MGCLLVRLGRCARAVSSRLWLDQSLSLFGAAEGNGLTGVGEQSSRAEHSEGKDTAARHAYISDMVMGMVMV